MTHMTHLSGLRPRRAPIFRSPWGTLALLAVVWAPIVWLLAGCSGTGGTQTTVYAAATALTAADNVAIQYVTLPLCGPAHAKPLCSEASVSTQIKQAAQAAHDAVKAAERAGDSATLAAANAAIAALVAVTPKPAA